MSLVKQIKVCDKDLAGHYLECIKSYPEEYWSKSGLGGGKGVSPKANLWRTSQELNPHLIDQNLYTELNDLIGWSHTRYKNELVSSSPEMGFFELTAAIPAMAESASILRYGPGEYYDWHVDEKISGFEIIGPKLTMVRRSISSVLYLNDDFEGGETDFGGHGLVSPQAGYAVVFPSNRFFPHRSCEIKSGTKYALVSWFLQREILDLELLNNVKHLFSND